MTRNSVGIAAGLVVLTIVGTSAIAGAMLPESIRLPIHWDLLGQPDQFADKWIALMSPAAMVGLVSLLFYFLPALEPRKEGLARSQGLYLWGWTGLLLMGAVIELVLLSTAFGWGLRNVHLLAGGVGILLMLIGNQAARAGPCT